MPIKGSCLDKQTFVIDEVRLIHHAQTLVSMVMKVHTRFIISCLVVMIVLKVTGIQAMGSSGSLDDTFEEYAHNSLPARPKTGVLYDASLPSNFTGVQVSIVRLRWDSFWRRGANYSGFHMPPRIFSYPFFTRLDIVYSSLDNQSSYYYDYNVPNHTLVAPVVGFNAYGSTAQMVTKLNLTLLGGPILIQFPNISLEQNDKAKAKCVTFYPNGTFEMTAQEDMMCQVREQGHFSMVAQVQTPPSILPKEKERGRRLWKWWVVGFSIGVIGLLFIAFIVFMIIRMRRNIARMEREAQRNEALQTTNVGQTKMPVATLVRTQPTIENDYVP